MIWTRVCKDAWMILFSFDFLICHSVITGGLLQVLNLSSNKCKGLEFEIPDYLCWHNWNCMRICEVLMVIQALFTDLSQDWIFASRRKSFFGKFISLDLDWQAWYMQHIVGGEPIDSVHLAYFKSKKNKLPNLL